MHSLGPEAVVSRRRPRESSTSCHIAAKEEDVSRSSNRLPLKLKAFSVHILLFCIVDCIAIPRSWNSAHGVGASLFDVTWRRCRLIDVDVEFKHVEV